MLTSLVEQRLAQIHTQVTERTAQGVAGLYSPIAMRTTMGNLTAPSNRVYPPVPAFGWFRGENSLTPTDGTPVAKARVQYLVVEEGVEKCVLFHVLLKTATDGLTHRAICLAVRRWRPETFVSVSFVFRENIRTGQLAEQRLNIASPDNFGRELRRFHAGI